LLLYCIPPGSILSAKQHCDYHDLNKVIEGMDGSDRPFRSTYTHVPGSNVLSVVKTITGGLEEGSSWSETVVLAAPL
jgi:hypothetical protein